MIDVHAESSMPSTESIRPRLSPLLRPVVLLTLLLLGPVTIVQAQSAASRSASFTEGQAAAGANVYTTACAGCHMRSLQGGAGIPGLTSAEFRSSWGARPVGELLQFVRQTKPPQAPGSLADPMVAAVVAYLMSVNGAPPGEVALSFRSHGAVLGRPGDGQGGPGAGGN
jgi:mono/diheme cytochrome c family protein